MKRLVVVRRIVQTVCAFLFVYILWSTTYPLTGGIHPAVLFHWDPLIMIMTAVSERVMLPVMYGALIMLVLTFIGGRFFCGWMCPLGTCIDWAGAAVKKYGRRGLRNSLFRGIKFVLLLGISISALAGMQVVWIADPVVIAARFVSLNFIPTITLMINTVFIFIIQKGGLHGGPVHDLYRSLKYNILGIDVHYFANAGIILACFVAILALTLWCTRFWCRNLCPLGALYACVGRFSLLKRRVDKCISCKQCITECRMGAITGGSSYRPEECILCMDCIYDCPVRQTSFSFFKKHPEPQEKDSGISRRNFLVLTISSIAALGFRKHRGTRSGNIVTTVIRPPGALVENNFLNQCIRCGNCMKVCITNGLQPVFLESGIQGVWTPRLVPEIGYCEYNCTLCGNVCPTGAIPKLTQSVKQRTKLGVAKVKRGRCLAWAEGKQCLVCEEHCPVSDKAIKVVRNEQNGKTVLVPKVDPYLCIGCGICQNKCPVRPHRAIIVDEKLADRTSV